MVFLFFFEKQAYINIKENGSVLNVILYYIQFCSDYFCLTIATLNSPVSADGALHTRGRGTIFT